MARSRRDLLTILTTGGTIENTYNEKDGRLANAGSILSAMLACLRLPGVSIRRCHLLSKDSLDITPRERAAIVRVIRRAAARSPVVVLHGTDTLAETGRALCAAAPRPPRFPVVFTGAMRPFGFERSDAVQNLTEAIAAARRAKPGCYLAFHGRLLDLPHVVKDRRRGTFVAVRPPPRGPLG